MVRFFKYIAVSCWLLAAGTLSSCQEGNEAGDLLGQWRMSGSDTRYLYFSGSIASFRGINEGEVFGNFQHVGDSLFIQCYSIKEVLSDTLMVEESFGFKPFKNIRVKIESMDGDRLILSKEQQHWSFDKY
jgi:hypothetical protein